MKNYKVLFLARNISNSLNFQTEVTAASEAKAKIAARSELLAEGLNPFSYKAPVVTVTRPNKVVA